ncbi:MAG: TRAP transporter TatT component family protein [Pseudomonadota bacterium]
MRRVQALFTIVLLLVFSAGAAADDLAVKRYMKKGDMQFQLREDPAAVESARGYYEKVLAVDGENVIARWKLSMLFYWQGSHTEGTKARLAIFEKGIRYAQEGVERAEDCVPCHFWLGVSYAKYGESKGILHSLDLVPHVRGEMELVRKLDPTYDYGGADRVLGRLLHKLPAMNGGDNKKAIEHLRKAIEIGPGLLMNQRFLAEVLISEGRKDEARALLEHVVAVPEAEMLKSKIPDLKEEQGFARKLLEEHFK